MRILEALSIIDDAVYQCREKSVDTPAINAALDLLQVHLPRMRPQIEAFRAALNSQNYGVEGLEKQQRELRDRIPPIHDAVRNKLKAHIKTLEFRRKVKPDEKTKAEIERLTLELEGLPEQSVFFHGKHDAEIYPYTMKGSDRQLRHGASAGMRGGLGALKGLRYNIIRRLRER